MRIEYSYSAGMNWVYVIDDLIGLIVQGADYVSALASENRALCRVVGEPCGWGQRNAGGPVARNGLGGGVVGFDMFAATGAAVDGVYIRPMGLGEAFDLNNANPVYAMAAGQNSVAGYGATLAVGQIRVAVNEHAIAFSFNYGTGRQLALVGEMDGDFFGTAYPRGFVMSSQAVASGAGLDAVARVPYFERLKNHAAAGDKTGLSAAGLAFAASPSAATNGYVLGVNEALIYQAMPLEVWSNPKAAHLGFVRGVMMAPGKNVANDDFLTINGEEYVVFRENVTAALAIAMKA